MSKTTLKVSGMTCQHCVKSVSDALGSLDGVRSADVDLEAGTATVLYDEDEVDPSRMIQAVDEQGYGAQVAA